MRFGKSPFLAAFAMACVLIKSSYGQGFVDWGWSFDQAQYLVGPSDSIALTATIFVRPGSPGPLAGHAYINFQGSLFAQYNFDCDVCGDDRIINANFSPGSSLQFSFGTLTPRSPLAPGIYRNMPDEPLIDFDQLGTRHISEAPLRIEVVPEPAMGALVFFGVGLVVANFRRVSRSR